MTNPYLILALLILLGGSVGGFANFLNTKSDKDGSFYLWRCVFSGIAAAIVVPLFLETIQSSLIEHLGDTVASYFAFLGFCVLAAFSSRSFLDNLAKRALRTAEDAKKKADEVSIDYEKKVGSIEAVLAKETEENAGEPSAGEPSIKAQSATSASPEQLEAEDLDPSSATLLGNISLSSKPFQVLKALANQRYTFRTVEGVVAETKLTQAEVTGCLSRLNDLRLAGQSQRSNGPRWYATAQGRALISSPRPANLFSEPDQDRK